MQEMATEVVEKFPDWRNEIESIKENVQKLGFTPDLESILTVLSGQLDPSRAIKEIGPLASIWPAAPLPPSRSELQSIANGIRNYVRQACQVTREKIPKIVKVYSNFFRTLGDVGRSVTVDKRTSAGISGRCSSIGRGESFYYYFSTDIFTTNYDVCIETYCNETNVPLFAGFEMDSTGTRLIFSPHFYNHPDRQHLMRLYKLHGSVDQFVTRRGDVIKMSFPPAPETTFYGEEPPGELLIYPTHEKYIYQYPFFDMFSILKNRLEERRVCIVIGYSFRDSAVNDVFKSAVRKNKRLKIILVDPVADKIISENVDAAIRKNVFTINGKFGDSTIYEPLIETIKTRYPQ